MPTIVVAGAASQNPGYGGHRWVFLNYLLGFRRLGYEVLLIDRLITPQDFGHVRALVDVLERFGLAGAYCALGPDGETVAGRTREQVITQLRDCELLLNVMGFLRDEELLGHARRRVFLDIDPGVPQMWCELDLADLLSGHDVYVTLGGRVGRPDCTIPTCDRTWLPTRPPVVLEHWPEAPAPAQPSFLSIGAWRGPFAPIDYAGTTYGLRVHEFRRLAELPRAVPARFRAALDIEPADAGDRERLAAAGWELLAARAHTSSPWSYQRLIAGAGAELMVAKQLYVRTRSGWFSDRSACFLATGRPVLALDTALDDGLLAGGEGLLAFANIEQAAAGARAILADYPRHKRAARALAERWFDSDLVLSELLAGVENQAREAVVAG